jgi:hypothetical protein
LHDTPHEFKKMNMKPESFLSTVRKSLAGEIPAQQAATEMRPLTEDELLAVAGGPEVEVGNGT